MEANKDTNIKTLIDFDPNNSNSINSFAIKKCQC